MYDLLKINIQQPFYQKFINLKSWFWKISKHKGLEINLYFDTTTLLLLSLQYTSKKHDHNGIQFGLGVLFFELEIHFYDNRHADEYE